MRFFLHYLPVHLQTCGVLRPCKPGRARHQQCTSFPTALGWTISVNLRENKLPFIAERSTKIIWFLREGGKMKKRKAKGSNTGMSVWSWMPTLNHLSLHAEVMLKVCCRGWKRNWLLSCLMSIHMFAWHSYILVFDWIRLKMEKVLEIIGSVQSRSKD